MPDSSFLKLSLFVVSQDVDPPAICSLRSFANGAVGLGIIITLSGSGDVGGHVRSAMLTRSESILIASDAIPYKAMVAHSSGVIKWLISTSDGDPAFGKDVD
ncbi:hypothetical protein COCNU_03G014720 [Cocos nucifera]|uniref:Uncharacterized protein n=1 Tax=Cocos nucifera TaxID=13894 RepID=A0A8K0MZB6_COCNU|nr:hypothetical protein COCNU_03G014720 [Cocos nucifera]